MPDFSNSDGDVFLVKLERMIDRGALLSRYSRTSNLDIRDVYLKEFENDSKRGEDFYRRVFLEYGDESVAELVTAQVAIQNVSNILTKIIEEQRIGLSYLEKSSRYVSYSKKSGGAYLFCAPDSIGIPADLAGDYNELCNGLFEFYEQCLSPAQEFFKRKWPKESLLFPDREGNEVLYGALNGQDAESAEKSYRSAIRARALDDLRALLPASTKTNVGISGNGRAFIYLIQRLKSLNLPEARRVADSLYRELSIELPELMNAAINRYGERQISYMSEELEMVNPVEKHQSLPVCSFIDWDREPSSAFRVAAILQFQRTGEDLSTIMREMQNRGYDEVRDLLVKYSSKRSGRRDKVSRAYESCNYFLQVAVNFGAFRDVQRHRFLSISRPPLTPYNGYTVPEFFKSDPATLERFNGLMEEAAKLYGRIRHATGHNVAQYVIPFAYVHPVSINANVRELIHFCELRSTPQSHYDLRNLSRIIYEGIKERTPAVAAGFRFVDTAEYALGRLRAEQRKEIKLRDMDR